MRHTLQATATTLMILLAVAPTTEAEVRIRDLQGRAHLSPLRGLDVAGVGGIVTAHGRGGFFLQDPEPDLDPASSEGIFVYGEDAESFVEDTHPAVGCEIDVDGLVSEFRPRTEGLSITEIQAQTWRTLRCGQELPATVVLDESGRRPPLETIDDDDAGSAEAIPPARFEPDSDAIDFYESLEGMRVELPRARVVEAADRFGDWWGVMAASSDVRVARALPSYDEPHPERLRVVSPDGSTPPSVGDVSEEPLRGPLHYRGSAFELIADEAPLFTAPRRRPRKRSRLHKGRALTLATWNLRNLAGNAASEDFRRRAERIVDALGSPDVLVVQEVQDADGTGRSAGPRGAATLERLIRAISRADGPTYHYLQIDPEDGADGGVPHANIRVAILYDPERIALPEPSAHPKSDDGRTASVVCTKSRARLRRNPSLISRDSPAFARSRKPLVAELRFRGKPFFAIALHLTSRRGDDPLFGWAQPPRRPSARRRSAQAEQVAGFVERILDCERNANVVVAGDLNTAPDSHAVDLLEASGLRHLGRRLRPEDRYSFIYEGNATLLDAILISPAIALRPQRIVAVHRDTQIPFWERVSDHDALVARLRLD